MLVMARGSWGTSSGSLGVQPPLLTSSLQQLSRQAEGGRARFREGDCARRVTQPRAQARVPALLGEGSACSSSFPSSTWRDKESGDDTHHVMLCPCPSPPGACHLVTCML